MVCCPASRFNGPQLTLLAPAAERERSAHMAKTLGRSEGG